MCRGTIGWSTTRQRKCFSPLIFTKTSYKCQRQRLGLVAAILSFRISAAKNRSEPMPQESKGVGNDIDTAPMQQVLEISKRELKRNIKHHRRADDLVPRREVTNWAGFGHFPTLVGPLPLAQVEFLSEDPSTN